VSQHKKKEDVMGNEGRDKVNCLVVICAVVLGIALCAPSLLFADAITIVSDASWKSTNSAANPGCNPANDPGPAWTNVSFDDSTWATPTVYTPPIPYCPIVDTGPSSYMWYGGNGGPNETFYRYSFNLNSPVITANASLCVDDELQFYVNGALVLEDLSGGHSANLSVDIISYLQTGENVLAIRAWDGAGCSVYGHGNQSLAVLVEIETEGTIVAEIDIKPGSFPNCFNVNGHGVIPVAILGSADFDVTQINPTTLSFAGLSVRVKGNDNLQCSVEDVSGDFSGGFEGAPDGYDDLVCQFVDDADLWSADTGTATVTGNLLVEFGGTPFAGTDTICLAPAE
jgi:hypothetical protein